MDVMRFRLLLLTGALAATSVTATLACSSPTIPDEELGGDQNVTAPTRGPKATLKRDAGGAGAADTPSGSTPQPAPATTTTNQGDASTGGAAPGPPPNVCASSANLNACYGCCETATPKGLPFLDNAWGECVCVAPGACASACSNEYCAGQPVFQGSPCDACLAANEATCETQAEKACAANADCKPLLACVDSSKCATKPQ